MNTLLTILFSPSLSLIAFAGIAMFRSFLSDSNDTNL